MMLKKEKHKNKQKFLGMLYKSHHDSTYICLIFTATCMLSKHQAATGLRHYKCHKIFWSLNFSASMPIGQTQVWQPFVGLYKFYSTIFSLKFTCFVICIQHYHCYKIIPCANPNEKPSQTGFLWLLPILYIQYIQCILGKT